MASAQSSSAPQALPFRIIKLTSAAIASEQSASVLFEHRADLDALGIASGISQKLKGPLTSYEKVMDEKALAEKQFIYLVFTSSSSSSSSSSDKLFGFLKMGIKTLYLTPSERSPLRSVPNVMCALDFYVNSSAQRSGVGRALFESMLADVGGEELGGGAERLAYDRPSDMMLPFLKRHFGLEDGYWNSNNYVTFGEGFWKGRETPDTGRKRR